MSREKGLQIKQGIRSQAIGQTQFLTVTKAGVLIFSKKRGNIVSNKHSKKTKT